MKKIIVVDKERMIRYLLTKIIEKLEVPDTVIITCNDHESALRNIQKDPCDADTILVAQIKAPLSPENNILSTVKKQYPHIRIIAMSGKQSREEEAQKLGADAFVLKGGLLKIFTSSMSQALKKFL